MPAAGIGVARASDHQDNPLVELNPAMDMTDVYAFPGLEPGPHRARHEQLGVPHAGQAPTTTFDPNLLYQFKIDNTGDAKEDRVIQVFFKGTGANQTVEVRGPIAPPVAGAMNNKVVDVDARRHRRDQSGHSDRRPASRCSPALAKIRSSSISSSSSASCPTASRRPAALAAARRRDAQARSAPPARPWTS